MAKHYALEEANALLPHLAPTLVELRRSHEQAQHIRKQIGRAALTNGWSHERERWSKTLAQVAALLERLDHWNVVLRDLATGLVDFPTVVGGESAYFCWRLGEPEVAHWHSPEDGFRGRRSL